MKGHTGKKAVNRHQTQSKASAGSQERAIERKERQHAKKVISEELAQPFEEPESCDECESTEKMEFLRASLNGRDNVPAWICGDCGHAHLNPTHDDDCQGC